MPLEASQELGVSAGCAPYGRLNDAPRPEPQLCSAGGDPGDHLLMNCRVSHNAAGVDLRPKPPGVVQSPQASIPPGAAARRIGTEAFSTADGNAVYTEGKM